MTSPPQGAEISVDALVPIVTFRHEQDNKPSALILRWSELVTRLTRHEQRAAKDGPAWSPVTYKPGTKRAKANIDQVHALVLDVDHVELPHDRLAGLSWVAHTTHSHNPPDDPRWRVVIPLSHPVPGNEQSWSVYWLRARERFGEAMDEACKDASRMYFWPACRPRAPHQTEFGDGDLLDPDSLPEVRAPELTRPVGQRRTWSGDIKAYARKALEDEIAKVVAAPPGGGSAGNGRNVQLNRSAFALGQLVAGGELPRALVEQELLTAAERCGLINDDGMRATERTIASGLNSAERTPRTTPAPPPPLRMPPKTNGANGTNGNGHHADVVDTVPLVRQHQDEPPEKPPAATATSDADHRDFHLTDLGNAQRMVAEHGIDLRYAHQHGRWYIWDGTHWAEDATAEVERRAKRTVRAMYALAAGEELDEDQGKALVKHALRSESHKAIGAMVALARSEPSIPVTVDELDRYPWLLNVENGTLDLRTGELRRHRREDLLTRLAPVPYDPEAKCPTWLAFLERIMDGNEQLIEFLQRAVGYTLTGSARERVLFMLHGGGANGKSTLLETIAALLGPDYAKSTRAETLLVKTYDGGIPNDLAALKGARFVSTSETEEGKRMAEALVKTLTGGDTISARFMRGEFFTFRATFKLWLATNHKPVIRGTDPAIWDRIKLIPFDVRIPDEEQDKELPSKLDAERPGILAWAVRGCLEWQHLHGLGVPSEVRIATANYRQDMDTVAAFLEECCVIGDGATERAKRLWEKWQTWCQDAGERPGTQKSFGLRLKEKGFQQGRSRDREQARVWLGLGLAGEAQQAPLNADAFEMQTRTDANPGISALSAPHVALPRETRLHASARQNASAIDATVCRACGRDLNETELAAGFGLHWDCTEPRG